MTFQKDTQVAFNQLILLDVKMEDIDDERQQRKIYFLNKVLTLFF